jgi:hypothetical protein
MPAGSDRRAEPLQQMAEDLQFQMATAQLKAVSEDGYFASESFTGDIRESMTTICRFVAEKN